MSQSAVSIPAADPASHQRQFQRALGPHTPAGSAESLFGSRGALLGVIPLGAGSRLAVVGYLLPPGRQDDLVWPAGKPADGLVVDAAGHRALVNGNDVGLVYREFELLAFLTARPRRAFTRAHLLANVWGAGYQGSTRTVDVHVHRIRRKLGPEYGQRLVTMRHLGYAYQPHPVHATPERVVTSPAGGMLGRESG